MNALAGSLDSNGDIVDAMLPPRPEDDCEALRDLRLGAALDPDSTVDLADHLARIAAVTSHATRVHPLTW